MFWLAIKLLGIIVMLWRSLWLLPPSVDGWWSHYWGHSLLSTVFESTLDTFFFFFFYIFALEDQVLPGPEWPQGTVYILHVWISDSRCFHLHNGWLWRQNLNFHPKHNLISVYKFLCFFCMFSAIICLRYCIFLMYNPSPNKYVTYSHVYEYSYVYE